MIEVGPTTVRASNAVPEELVSTAIEYIDDDLALLGESAVPVADLWDEVMSRAAGPDADAVLLVCPTWWSTARIDLVRAAAESVVAEVVVERRTPLLQTGGATVVEIAAELVVVTRVGATAAVIPVLGDADHVAAQVHTAAGASAAVLVDAPDGAGFLGDAILRRLCANGIAAVRADAGAVRCAALGRCAVPQRTADRPRRWPRASALAGVAASVAVCGGFVVGGDGGEPGSSTLLVEGRVGVLVPADWPVERVTTGPGSARLQIVSPSRTEIALHVTQSVGAPDEDVVATAESLRAALAGEPDGVFVDFNGSDARAGRPAVTYREVRPHRHVAWAVLVQEGVRIAIGCQSAPAHQDQVREVCDQAIRSARAVP